MLTLLLSLLAEYADFVTMLFGKSYLRAVFIHCVKRVQIRSFPGTYFPTFGPEKPPYLDTFHAVIDFTNLYPFRPAYGKTQR